MHFYTLHTDPVPAQVKRRSKGKKKKSKQNKHTEDVSMDGIEIHSDVSDEECNNEEGKDDTQTHVCLHSCVHACAIC